MYENEKKFVYSFANRNMVNRYNNLLVSEKKRKKFLEILNHDLYLNLDLSVLLPARGFQVDQLERELTSRGSPPTCYIIADSSKYDGKYVSLCEAMLYVSLHNYGIILSCLPGRLALYKAESPSDILILQN